MPKTEYLKIPLDRVGPLIGTKGEVKKEIERLTGTSLFVNSDDGTVSISADENMEDPFGVLKSYDIVKSIGKGFNPETAIKLNDDDLYLEVVKLNSYINESEKELDRQIAKIIGKKGIVVKNISSMAEISIKVYNEEVSLIGEFENVMTAKKAVEMLLNGVPHKTVYNFLKTEQKERK